MTIARDLANVASLMASSGANVAFDNTITVSSTAAVANLNADLLDGYHASYFINQVDTLPSVWARTFAMMGA